MRLIDSHCHIHDSEFFGELREEVYARAVQACVGMICVGTDERSSAEAVEFARSHDMTWAAVGVHPHDAKLGWEGIKDLLSAGLVDVQKSSNRATKLSETSATQVSPAAYARETWREAVSGDFGGESTVSPIIAIGEIGLDYFYEHSPRDVQRRALEAQLQLAIDYNLPVSFHVRDGFADFWPIVDNFPKIRGVLHSFTDSQDNADRGLERGFLIGINGISTFTKDLSQRELYRNLPLDKILVETDAPYLTPKPLRGKMNEPGYVELIVQSLATERNLSIEEVAQVTLQNTRQFFNI